ncbi:MAG: hypothetical protein WC807_14850 [Hyphomicrobium sp.]|jgi:microcystin-dependent protein
MPADTNSTLLGLLLQGTGNNSNSWGENLNNFVFTYLENAVAGYSAISVNGGSDTLTAAQHRTMLLDFTGTLAAEQTVEVDNTTKRWIVRNATTGAYALKFKTASGTAVTIPQGGICELWCNGNDTLYVGGSFDASGRILAASFTDGTISLPGIAFASEPAMGVRRVSSGTMALTVGGVDIATISATGVNVATGLALSVGGAAVVPSGTEVQYTGIRAPTGWYFEYGQTLTRADDPGLLAALTEAFTADTNGTTTLSNVSADLRNLGLEGSTLEGTGMATGAVISSVDSATQITMSLAATNTATGGAVRAFPYGNGDGSTTFKLPDARGTTAFGRGAMGGTDAALVTFAVSGIRGERLNGGGGAQSVTLAANQIPSLTSTGNNTITVNSTRGDVMVTPAAVGSGSSSTGAVGQATITSTGVNSISVAYTNGSQQVVNKMPPARVRNVIIKR